MTDYTTDESHSNSNGVHIGRASLRVRSDAIFQSGSSACIWASNVRDRLAQVANDFTVTTDARTVMTLGAVAVESTVQSRRIPTGGHQGVLTMQVDVPVIGNQAAGIWAQQMAAELEVWVNSSLAVSDVAVEHRVDRVATALIPA